MKNEKVNVTECCLEFTGVGEVAQQRKLYKLNLEFHGKVRPDLVDWSLASVGKMKITVAKKHPLRFWPYLFDRNSSKTKQRANRNWAVWSDMQDKLVKESTAIEADTSKLDKLIKPFIGDKGGKDDGAELMLMIYKMMLLVEIQNYL